MLTGIRTGHIKLVAAYGVRFSMRTGGGIMALLIVLIAGLLVAAAFVTPLEILMAESREAGGTAADDAAWIDQVSRSDQIVNVVSDVTAAGEAEVSYLLQDNPALLSAIWLILLIIFPFLTCVIAFNQTAGDIGNRGLRYVLLRTERVNIFFGRFLGALVFAAISIALVMSLLIVYIGVKFNIYPLWDMVQWGLQGYLALLLIYLPYSALCAWFSAMLGSAMGALALCLVVTGVPIIFITWAGVLMPAFDLDWMMMLLPWGWKYGLLASGVGERLLAYGIMLGFTVVFLALGLRTFTKRDL